MPLPRFPRVPRFLLTVVQTATLGVVVLFARASLADHYRVPSGSMEPTVHVGDRIVVSKASYGVRLPFTNTWLVRFTPPQRGEVVVIDPPEDGSMQSAIMGPDGTLEEMAPGTVLLKRVIATEGETVEVVDGHVRIDGRFLNEEWASFVSGGGPDFGPARVPAGKVLLLGDNRGNSRDGRAFGFVDVNHVLGRAVAVVARDGRAQYRPLGH